MDHPSAEFIQISSLYLVLKARTRMHLNWQEYAEWFQ